MVEKIFEKFAAGGGVGPGWNRIREGIGVCTVSRGEGGSEGESRKRIGDWTGDCTANSPHNDRVKGGRAKREEGMGAAVLITME